MKRIATLLLACSALFAEEEKTYTYWDAHPFRFGANAIALGNADVSDVPEKGHLNYQKYNVYTTVLLPISKTSYFFPRVEWNYFKLNWDKNPRFSQDTFNYMQFALTYYTTMFEKWRWIMRGSYNIATNHFSEPHDYGLFEGLVWGTYEFHRKWHYHIGAFGYTGFESRQMYPVIGLDWSPDKKWTFLIVFPIDYAIQYKVGENWRFSLKGRPLRERFRTDDNKTETRAIFNYSSMGGELNAHYERFLRLELDAYVGYNFGGSYYLKNAQGHQPIYTSVGGSIYGGASCEFDF